MTINHSEEKHLLVACGKDGQPFSLHLCSRRAFFNPQQDVLEVSGLFVDRVLRMLPLKVSVALYYITPSGNPKLKRRSMYWNGEYYRTDFFVPKDVSIMVSLSRTW